MSALHFGAVQVNQASQHGQFAHLQITVTEDDRDAFRPNLEHFGSKEREMAGTDGDAWTFTLGVGSNKSGIRVIPGHADSSQGNIFAGLFSPVPVYGGPRDNVKFVIRQAATQVSDEKVQRTLNEWLV